MRYTRAPTTAGYVGSAKSNKYHRPDCVWAQKINPAKLVTFKSPQERTVRQLDELAKRKTPRLDRIR